MEGQKYNIILREDTAWSAGLIKKREERYKQKCWKNTDKVYIGHHSKEEIARRLKEHDNCEIKSDFFWSEETGPLTNMWNKPPIRMLIDNDRVMTAAKFKKFLYVFLQEMQYSTWYEKIGILLSMRKLRNIYLESVYRGITEYLIEPKYITPPVREIRRCIEKVFPGDGKYEWEGYYSDPPCFYLEYDPAYRYRLQDILFNVDKESVFKEGNNIMGAVRFGLWFITNKDRFLYRTTREAKRLAELLILREVNNGGHWAELETMVVMAIQCSTNLRNKFYEFVKEIDLDKIKLNQYDKYWAYGNFEYDYDGLSYAMRKKLNDNYDNLRNN
jgi:hypothetical protein